MRHAIGRYGLWVGVALLYLYGFPHFPEIRSANELPRAYLTQAMVDEGTFAIDSGVKRWGTTADVSPSRGHHYSNKAPGSSMLAIPGYLVLKGYARLRGSPPTLGEMLWVFRFTTGIVPTLLFLVLLSRFLSRFCADAPSRRLVVVGYALGTMAMTYSVLFISHQLSAVCIATAYFLIVWVSEDGLDERWLFAAGAAAGAAPLVDYQGAFAGIPIAVYLIYKALANRPLAWRRIVYAGLGAAVPIAILFAYHNAAFGSPLKTGYDASETFAHFHQQGFLGMTELRWEAFVGSTVRSDNGLIYFSPMWLLALPGLWFLRRQRQYWHLGIAAAVIVIYLLFISSLNFWRGGWQMGPRYITAMLPFALVPVAAFAHATREVWWARGLLVGSVGIGMFVYVLGCGLYPHFPEKFAHPISEVTMRLLRDGHAPANLGGLLGLSGFLSLLPYLLVAGGVFAAVAIPRRALWRSASLGAAIAVVISTLYASQPSTGPAADEAYRRWVAGVMPN